MVKRRTVKANERRIEQIYYRNCSGVQVDVMDIGKIFRAGETALAANPSISETDLTKVVVDFVQTIRKN